jgi:hypothetical protein
MLRELLSLSPSWSYLLCAFCSLDAWRTLSTDWLMPSADWRTPSANRSPTATKDDLDFCTSSQLESRGRCVADPPPMTSLSIIENGLPAVVVANPIFPLCADQTSITFEVFEDDAAALHPLIGRAAPEKLGGFLLVILPVWHSSYLLPGRGFLLLAHSCLARASAASSDVGEIAAPLASA